MAEYVYDAWGVCSIVSDSTEESIADINPYRYRGYYYDVESGLYYLQSRYYNPVVGRFLNADEDSYLGESGTVLGYNLFVYCENDPVTNIDPDGHLVITTTMLICAGIGALVLGVFGGFAGYHLSRKWKVPKGKRWKYVIGGVANKLLGKDKAWKFMKPLWQAAFQQFAKTDKGVVHVFLNASGINFESTFLTIEYWILRDLGVQMVFHLID